MTLVEFIGLWRRRRENPLVTQHRLRWTVLAVAASMVMAGGAHAVVLLAGVDDVRAQLRLVGWIYLLFPAFFHLIVLPLVVPPQRTSDQLEELLLTRLTRDEISFGLVYAPLRAAMSCGLAMSLVSSGIAIVILARLRGSFLASIGLAMPLFLIGFPILFGLLAIGASRSLMAWQENPARPLRNALVSLVQGAWHGFHYLLLAMLALVIAINFIMAGGSGGGGGVPVQVMILIAIALAVSWPVILLLRRSGAVWRALPAGIRFTAVAFPVVVVVSCVMVGEEAITILFPGLAFLFLLLPFLLAPLRFFTERALCRVYPEDYQEACWSAPDDPRRGEWRDRVELTRLLLRRLGPVNLARENLGIVLCGVLLILSLGVTGMLVGSLLGESAFALATRLVFLYSATPFVGVLLTIIRLWNEARLSRGRRIPVVKGAILMSSTVYIIGPFLCSTAHGILASMVVARPGEWILVLFMLMISFLLCLATALWGIPGRHRRRRLFLGMVVCVGIHVLLFLTTIVQYQVWWGWSLSLTEIAYFPEPGMNQEVPLMLLGCGLLYLSALGIPALAQRVHDEETRGVPRFGVTGGE